MLIRKFNSIIVGSGILQFIFPFAALPFLCSISNILHIIQQSVDGKLLSVTTEDLEVFQSRLVILQV